MLQRKALIAGGTGFIGSKLSKALIENGYKLTILTRKNLITNSANLSYINNLDEAEFDYDIVINLCGETISCRWSDKKKKEIYDSRILTTRALAQKILDRKVPPSLFISGSAIGYYGTSSTKVFQEKSLPTNQKLFSQKVCFDWEKKAMVVEEKTRLVFLRTGVVIGKNGGIIKKMFLPFYLGLGGKIASGKQDISWIHIDDEVGAILHIIKNPELKGPVNLTSPNHTSNLQFSKSLAKALRRPCLFAIPGLSMKLAYGKMADELLLNGQKVYPKVLIESGYKFKFSDLSSALEEVFPKSK